jgi:apolipoprotein N-acyltransferase
LRLAELTSVAFGLPLVRSANTGVSVVNDAFGRQIDGLALGATGTIETGLPRAAEATVFARWGNAPFWLAFLAIWVVTIVVRLRMRALID